MLMAVVAKLLICVKVVCYYHDFLSKVVVVLKSLNLLLVLTVAKTFSITVVTMTIGNTLMMQIDVSLSWW